MGRKIAQPLSFVAQKSTSSPSWDDLRYVAAVARHGSLLKAARELGVDHTTVGRRVAAAEAALGVTLFLRSTSGLTLTPEVEALLEPLQHIEDAVATLTRQVESGADSLVGEVKVTAPESFGVAWLASRLATLSRRYPGLRIVLDPSGAIADLARREAEVALRFFRSQEAHLVTRHVGDVVHGLYGSRAYLARHPVRGPQDVPGKALLSSPPDDVEAKWLARLSKGTAPVFTCVLAVAQLAAVKTGVGLAVLPRWLGDHEPDLVYLPMPNEPRERLWLTVHKDLRKTPRVRAVLDFLVEAVAQDPSLARSV